jgi:N-acyl-L-homoserine lactone synthetase
VTVELRRATSRQELEDVFVLRHQVFAVEEGKLPLQTSRMLFDRFDSFVETVSLIAYVDGAPAGSIRITLDGPLGSPLDGHYDLGILRERCSVNGVQAPTAVVTSLCVRRDMRRTPRVTGGLLEAAVDVMERMGAQHVIAIINPHIGSLMQRVGLERVGAPRHCPRVDQQLISLHAPLSAISIPRLDAGELEGTIRYLATGEPLAAEWSVVLSGRLSLPGGKTAGPGTVVGGPGIQALVPSAVRVVCDEVVRDYAARAPEEILRRASATESARGDLFNGLLQARVLGALDALGVIELLDGTRSTTALAEATELDADVLGALLTYLTSAELVRFEAGWLLASPSQVRNELAFVRWLMGGYGPLLDDLHDLVRGVVQFEPSRHRNDREVAGASAEIGRRMTDAHLARALTLPGVQRIADIGCGGAQRLISLCQRMPHLSAVGIDLSDACCRLADENIATAGLSERISVVHGRAEDWIAQAGVDVVMSVGMFHDLLNTEGAAEAFLSRVRAGLGSGGMLLIQDQLAVTADAGRSWGPGFAMIHHLMDQALFTEEDYLRAFSAGGFRLLRRVATDIPDNWIFLLEAE